jgi:hypothetical protein
MVKYWDLILFPIYRGLRNLVEPRTQVYQPRLTALSGNHTISAQLLDRTAVNRIAPLDQTAVNAGTNRIPNIKMVKYWDLFLFPFLTLPATVTSVDAQGASSPSQKRHVPCKLTTFSHQQIRALTCRMLRGTCRRPWMARFCYRPDSRTHFLEKSAPAPLSSSRRW